ncbi:MAG: D-glycerate dehydrogenase [Gemmatimonadaceae bacterium]|nr:D-glycerate dehydrogenase [Gemmatimonadaceae bacterium]
MTTHGQRPAAYLTRRHTDAVETAFAEHFDVSLNLGDVPRTPAELIRALGACDVLVPIVGDPLDDTVFQHAPFRATLIANVGVGVNHIDLGAAARAGIAVTNTPDVLTDDTADLAIALMLMAARRLGEGERLVRASRWHGLAPTHHLGHTLRGRTLGIIGYGRIGRAVADRARVFGMRVQWIGRSGGSASGDPGRAESLDSLLGTSDIVSLHAPATSDTHHLIDAARLARMRPGSILVNTARGSLVDERALAEALRSGQLFAAGLDVHEFEPRINQALLGLENVVLLPHLGSATIETRTAMGMRALDNALQWLSGRPPQDRVA